MNHFHCDICGKEISEEHYRDGYCRFCNKKDKPIETNLTIDLEIIDKISRIRSQNNLSWMAILRLAFKHAPDEAKSLMMNITECDSEINRLSKQLAEND